MYTNPKTHNVHPVCAEGQAHKQTPFKLGY